MKIENELDILGKESVVASQEIKSLGKKEKNELLNAIIETLKNDKDQILEANKLDMEVSQDKLSNAMLDRLMLDDERFEGIIESIKNVITLDDPTGNILFTNERPNGMIVERVSVPLGVIGIIYESRPNVTIDATVLCLKAGNSVILRGGSECFNTNTAMVNSMQKAIQSKSVSKNIVQYVNTTDRVAVDYMLSKMEKYIDVIVPRGGKGLVKKVQDTAKIPVIGHLDGICHLYVDETSDPDLASKIVENAKLRRTGICGAAETVLIDEKCIDSHLGKIIETLIEGGCEVRGDSICMKFSDKVNAANEIDWETEYLDAIISIKIVKDVDEAIEPLTTAAKKLVGFNPSLVKEFARTTINFSDTGTNAETVGESNQKNFDFDGVYNQSIMRYNQVFASKVNITIEADFSLHAGDMIFFDAPSPQKDTKNDEVDRQTGGLYIVASLCHYITSERTLTKLCLIRDSFGRQGNHTKR